MNFYKSSGILRYFDNPYKLWVEVDPELTAFYRSLVPKSVGLKPQRYIPHISVIRKEEIPYIEYWGKYEGEEIVFKYESKIYHGKYYYWLNVYCSRLEEIRAELGLPISSEITRPPDGWHWCFHTTIGNIKDA